MVPKPSDVPNRATADDRDFQKLSKKWLESWSNALANQLNDHGLDPGETKQCSFFAFNAKPFDKVFRKTLELFVKQLREAGWEDLTHGFVVTTKSASLGCNDYEVKISIRKPKPGEEPKQ